jgi:hypothetical protein
MRFTGLRHPMCQDFMGNLHGLLVQFAGMLWLRKNGYLIFALVLIALVALIVRVAKLP